ncbi:Putative reactive intermediate deaminase TdcF [Blochmannia endosymbiont of Polyrhachis (Hedomyrma) turneri]|nr:Putative reactive intermediate deaminase TdcF [Blochmannia endosymbiont of Polyrhachis (Hedomyrma) turneri]
MHKTIINTKNAPTCIGPYVQALDTGKIIFISGQIGICPETKNIPNDIYQETYQVLENIKSIVQEAKLHANNIVRTTIFITNINNLNKINLAYKNFFEKNQSTFPTRSCVEVSNLPNNANIEIDAIAIRTLF